jgi:FMN phosphatase YigB (HAD superfamily)
VRPSRAVLFDLFGTLVEVDAERLPTIDVGGGPRPSTLPRWASLLDRYVGPTSPHAVIAAFGDAREPPTADRLAERASRLRFRAMLGRLGCAPTLLDEAAVVLSRAHMAAIADATAVPASHHVVLDAARCVGRVGIVTNFDDTAGAYAILARHGLLARVDTVAVSEAIGRRKPHPLPVVAALRSLEVEPGDAVLIGDGVQADVGAARAAGVRAVLVRRDDAADTRPPEDVVVVRRLSDVPAALGW